MSTTRSETRSSTNSDAESEFERLAEKADRAMAEVQTMPTELRIKALTLKSAIEEFHKVGLTQIVRKLKADPRGKELLFELVDMPEVYALFSMHGLIRADLRTQVVRVIEMVRPYMQSHGGDVELVDIHEKTVLVRLLGSCSGCSMSQVTLKNTVEESLKQHIPEIERVEVVNDPPTNLLQIQVSESLSDVGWIEGPLVDQLPTDRPLAFSSQGFEILLVRTQKGLRAYRNACAHQGLPLEGGALDAEACTLTCPWHGFNFDAETGECLTAPQCQLEAFPLRVIDDRIWVRPE